MSSTPRTAPKEAKETRIRQRKGVVKPTSAPLGSVSFRKFIYILAAVTLAFAVYYAYRMSEIQRIKANNLQNTMKQAQGKPLNSESVPTKENTRAELQRRIEELGAMLGVQPVLLASAIAGVVAPHMPDESSSSIVKEVKKEAKETNSIYSAFTEGLTAEVTAAPTATPTATATSASTGGMAATILSAVKAAGFDDMGMDAE